MVFFVVNTISIWLPFRMEIFKITVIFDCFLSHSLHVFVFSVLSQILICSQRRSFSRLRGRNLLNYSAVLILVFFAVEAALSIDRCFGLEFLWTVAIFLWFHTSCVIKDWSLSLGLNSVAAISSELMEWDKSFKRLLLCHWCIFMGLWSQQRIEVCSHLAWVERSLCIMVSLHKNIIFIQLFIFFALPLFTSQAFWLPSIFQLFLIVVLRPG